MTGEPELRDPFYDDNPSVTAEAGKVMVILLVAAALGLALTWAFSAIINRVAFIVGTIGVSG